MFSEKRLAEIRKEMKDFFEDLYNDGDIASKDFRNFIEHPNEDTFMYFEDNYDNDEVAVRYGASKGVFIFTEEDYVIKVPFLERVDYDDDMIEMPNFCEIEYDNFKAACAEGLDWFFTETRPLFEFKGVTFYVSEQAECNEDELDSNHWQLGYDYYCKSNHLEENDESRDEYNDEYWDMNSDERMLDLVELTYGSAIADTIFAFFRRQDINDTHCGNFGYRCGKLVIVDYSGFRLNSHSNSSY